MTIHRVKHGSIQVADFKPDAASNYRPKVLRQWFHDEQFIDCVLRVENEHGGNFELWADFVSPTLLTLPAGGGVTARTGSESMAQSIVDKIEVAPASNPTPGCDFVIFPEAAGGPE